MNLNCYIPISSLILMLLFCEFFVGIYVCPKCNHELFSAKAKYKHHTPWPAFTETLRNDSVSKEIETEPQESSKNTALKVQQLVSRIVVLNTRKILR